LDGKVRGKDVACFRFGVFYFEITFAAKIGKKWRFYVVQQKIFLK
jgi:hypothetical protein